jgi:phage shock protein C
MDEITDILPTPATPSTPSPGNTSPGAGGTRPPFRLRRSRNERMIAGVCGGLAEALGVDVVIVRLALVLATVLGIGAGVVLYLACWILMPLADEPDRSVSSELAPPPAHLS